MPALVEQDVVGLDVAVDDFVSVRVGERVGDLPGDAGRVPDREPPLGFEELAQGRAVDAPHDDVKDLLLPSDLVNRHDVRMLEPRDGLRLAQEARGDRGRRRELHVQDLHRDITIQDVVMRPEHGGKAPLTQQGTNGKFLTKRLLQARLEGFKVHGGGKS